MAVSPTHTGWHYDPSNSRLDVYYRGTRVAHFTASTFSVLGTAQAANTFTDSTVVLWGTDGDEAFVHRASTLNANTTLTSVVIGTPVTAATPADSLIMSAKTASGDFVWMLNDGSGNSWEYARMDSSAKLLVLNEAANDIDFRIEGDNNANMLVIDAGTDKASIGSAVVAGAALSIGNATSRDIVTAVGNQIHVPAISFTDSGAMGAIGELSVVRIGAETVVATNTITYTVAAGLHVVNPIASTGATFTDIRSIHSDGNIQIGAVSAFAMTKPTAAFVFKTGTAPAGAITTSGAIYTDGTTIKKLIADGTASDIQT